MWLDKLKELKKAKGLSSKQIAEMTNLPERTVSRIFSGETDDPYVSTLRSIAIALDTSLDDIFAETSVVVGSKRIVEIQAEFEKLKAEHDILAAEYAVLKDKVTSLTSENDILRLKLEHKEEIIAIHNYYNKIK